MYVYIIFYIVESKVEQASVVFNSTWRTISMDAIKLERVQQKFAALCFNHFALRAIDIAHHAKNKAAN
jgi:hypothetical protein